MKKIFLFTAMLLVGCTTYRELLKTYSTNSTPTESGFVYENDTIKVTYSFWHEDGVMSMKIYNKLNIPIFIDWKVSAFIDNKNSMQYWYDVENSTSVNTAINYYGLRTLLGAPVSVHNGVTNTNTKHPDRITSITPHSEISKEAYSIIPQQVEYIIAAGDYTSDNSPIKFRNYLYLATDEAFTHKFSVDNEFYVCFAKFVDEYTFEKGGTNNIYFYSEPTPYKNSPELIHIHEESTAKHGIY